MDDQDCWGDSPSFHPVFLPGLKPLEVNWKCKERHLYVNCKCHLELREYGQDESIYRSGDHPSSRWGIDGRSYPISKSQGISKMVSAFKDYSKQGLRLKLSSDELIAVNTCRIGKLYGNNVTWFKNYRSH